MGLGCIRPVNKIKVKIENFKRNSKNKTPKEIKFEELKIHRTLNTEIHLQGFLTVGFPDFLSFPVSMISSLCTCHT